MRKYLLSTVCLMLITATVCISATRNPHANWWGKAPVQKTLATGTVTNISSTNIAVQTSQGESTFTVDSNTRVIVRGTRTTIANVKVGDKVAVQFKLASDNVATALRIVVPKPNVKGKITAIQDNVITLKNDQGEYQATVGDTTKYRSRGYVGTLSDLRVGYKATAQGNINGNAITADAVEFTPSVAHGAIVAIDANTITIKTVKQLTIITTPSANTAVIIKPRIGPDKKGTLNDVKVGAPVNIGFTATENGTSPLLWIAVLTGA